MKKARGWVRAAGLSMGLLSSGVIPLTWAGAAAPPSGTAEGIVGANGTKRRGAGGAPPEGFDPAAALVGSPAPEFEGLEGWIHTAPRTLASLRGRIVIVEFFSPELYATSFRGSVARLNALLPALEGKGCALLAVSLETMAVLEDFAAQTGADFWIASDATRGIFDRFHVGALGRSFLIDREGIVRWSGFADRERRVWFREIDALAQGAAEPPEAGELGLGGGSADPPRLSSSRGHSSRGTRSPLGIARGGAGSRPGSSRSSRPSRSSRRGESALRELPFERSLARAERVARDEHRPILAIVTGGQDPADVELSRRIYRDARLRRLASAYVLVAASPHDHDEEWITEGDVTRKTCTVFGSLSCREHQAGEQAIRKSLIEENGLVRTPQHVILAEGRVLDARAGRISATQLKRFLEEGLRRFRAMQDR